MRTNLYIIILKLSVLIRMQEKVFQNEKPRFLLPPLYNFSSLMPGEFQEIFVYQRAQPPGKIQIIFHYRKSCY